MKRWLILLLVALCVVNVQARRYHRRHHRGHRYSSRSYQRSKELFAPGYFEKRQNESLKQQIQVAKNKLELKKAERELQTYENSISGDANVEKLQRERSFWKRVAERLQENMRNNQ